MMRLITTKPDESYEVYNWSGANYDQAPVTTNALRNSLGLAMATIALLLTF